MLVHRIECLVMQTYCDEQQNEGSIDKNVPLTSIGMEQNLAKVANRGFRIPRQTIIHKRKEDLL